MNNRYFTVIRDVPEISSTDSNFLILSCIKPFFLFLWRKFKQMRDEGFLCLKLLITLFCWCTLFLICEGAEKSKNSLSLTVPNKTIRVGLYPMAGYHNYENGEPVSGYGYDYLQYLKRYAPLRYEYSGEKYDWPDVIRLLEEGKLDLVTNIRKTPERESRFAFSKTPMGQTSTILTIRCGELRYRSGDYKKWNGIRIGLLKQNSAEQILTNFAKEKGFTWYPVFYDNTDQMLHDLQTGTKIDAVLSNNMRRLSNEWILERLDTSPFYMAVRKDKASLLKDLDSAMELLQMDAPDLCATLWEQYFSDKSDEIVFTKQEQDFIQKSREEGCQFTAVIHPDRFPISALIDGQYEGFLKDIADKIVKRTMLNIRFVPLHSVKEYSESLLDPKIDMIFDVKQNFRNAEKNNLILSPPYVSLSISLLHNRKSGHPVTSVAIIEKSQVSEAIRPLLSDDVTIQFCKSRAEAIHLVATGKCSVTCLYTSVAEYAVLKDPKVRLESKHVNNLPGKLSVGIRDSRNPLLVSIVNKSVASISEDFVSQVRLNQEIHLDSFSSFSRMMYQYPMIVFGSPCLFLLILSVFLWHLLIARKKEYLLGVVFHNIPVRYFIADVDGTLLQYNFGKELKRPTFRTLDDIKDDEVRLPLKELVARTLQEGKTSETIYTDSGTTRFSVASCLPKQLFGKPTVIAVSRDITELQKIRDMAKRNEEYFRLTLFSIGDGVITTDQKGNIVMLNPVAERMTGVRISEAIGQPHTKYFKIFSIGDKRELDSPILRTLRTGHAIESTDPIELISFDGKKQCHVASNSLPIHDETGNIIGAILIFRDITEEYHRRMEIQKDLANWQAISEIAQIYRFHYNPQTKEVFSDSKDLSNVWPITDQKAMSPQEWICAEDFDSWNRSYNDIVEGKKKQEIVEFRSRRDGKTRYFRGYIRGAEKPGGELSGFIQEITQYVEEQEKKNAIQNLWTACINTIPVALFVKAADDDFRYIQCNDIATGLIGKPADEIIGYTDQELFVNPDDALLISLCDRDVIRKGTVQRLHESALCADGKIHHFMTVKVPVTMMDGKPALLGISLDETEEFTRRQKWDGMLKDWEIAARVAKIASFRLNSKMQILSTTERIIELWPMLNGKLVAPDACIHPDDLEPYRKMYSLFLAAIRKKPPNTFVLSGPMVYVTSICISKGLRIAPMRSPV